MMKNGVLTLAVTLFFLIAVHSVQATTVMFTGHLTKIEAYGVSDNISQHLAVGDTFSGSFTYDNTVLTGKNVSGRDWFEYTDVLSDLSLTFNSGNSAGFTLTDRSDPNNRISVANLDKEDIVSLVYYLNQSNALDGLTNHNIVWRLYDLDANAIDNAKLTDLNFSTFFNSIDRQSNDIGFLSTTDKMYKGAEFELDTLTVKPSSVPVPGAIWLLGSGIIGLAGRRRKLPAKDFGQDA